ncbi:MAG: CDP-diacylglycerol--glycerol-3-phosphate 3-phosphatidyltransferase [Oscillospiraceae bacterium]|nr:MAG: CDP-diacylglycerol--glycerol-3-phosphate 3-phosphatidyltransferase [Oscillospiraceae bacterium]
MNLANKLTFLRIIMIPVMAVLYFFSLEYAAAAVFVLAVLTDMLDGRIARSRNMVTDFGKFLDPIADKLLNVTALIMLLWASRRDDPWAVVLTVCTVIIVAREFTVTGFRIIAATNRVVIAADKWGKIKTVTQDVAIVLLLTGNWPFGLIGIPMDYIVLIASTVLTVISGANYIVKNIAVFKGGDAFKEKNGK